MNVVYNEVKRDDCTQCYVHVFVHLINLFLCVCSRQMGQCEVLLVLIRNINNLCRLWDQWSSRMTKILTNLVNSKWWPRARKIMLNTSISKDVTWYYLCMDVILGQYMLQTHHLKKEQWRMSKLSHQENEFYFVMRVLNRKQHSVDSCRVKHWVAVNSTHSRWENVPSKLWLNFKCRAASTCRTRNTQPT